MSNEKILTEQQIRSLLSDVLVEENVIDPVYEISSGLVKGDGYTSTITRADVKGKNKELPLIIKCAPKDPKFREKLTLRSFFLQEIKFYDEIFPAFATFQHERGVKDPFRAVAKCYKTVKTEFEELLVLENLKVNGFRVFDKTKQMDDSHVKLVLQQYGKYHAVSFAMKDQDMDRFEGLTKNLENLFHTARLDPELFDMLHVGCDKMKLCFDEIAENDIYTAVSRWKENIMPFLRTLDKYSGKYGVLSHGDCWCNNMMFKYQDKSSTTPTELRLFDFQIFSLTTPVLDLSYFFYVSASQEMLDNLDDYLKVYHDSLREHMADMGSDVDQCYPYSALEEEWSTYSKFGLLTSTVIFRLMLRDDDEILDVTDTIHTEGGVQDTFMKPSKNDSLINERYRRLVLHFYGRKLIQ